MATNCRRCDCPLICLSGEKRSQCVRCLAVKWKKARVKQAPKKKPRPRKTERICKDCGGKIPTPNGERRRQCDACRESKKGVSAKRYYEIHKDALKIKERQRYLATAELQKQRAKAYYEAHREQVIARMRERRLANKVESTKLGMMR